MLPGDSRHNPKRVFLVDYGFTVPADKGEHGHCSRMCWMLMLHQHQRVLGFCCSGCARAKAAGQRQGPRGRALQLALGIRQMPRTPQGPTATKSPTSMAPRCTRRWARCARTGPARVMM